MTDGLTPDDFPAFFEAVHGVAPFPWQTRLLREWVATEKAWPAVLDLPTGSGKTAALDIAVFHLALEAHKGEGRRAPVRIAFVVDRRLIVDDAFERARRIADALAWSLFGPEETEKLETRFAEESNPDRVDRLHRIRAEPFVARVATRLGELAERKDRPLLTRRLRGGVPREDDWARTPAQPTILCSTVDQVGSRLLFRGYGISDRMKPVHAGLLGSDCLILLDEAHLAEPFRQTLAAIERLRRPDRAPWQAAVLTATPAQPGQRADYWFSLNAEDHADPVLSCRLAASKPTTLSEIQGRQGVASEDRRIGEIAERTKLLLNELRKSVPNPAIGVVVNRVIRARQVFDLLDNDLAEAGVGVSLIIGPARPADRERLTGELLAPIRTGVARKLERPLVLVATQTIEAGVDIDFDGLVTEAAPLDALRQRFGRLNRGGRPIESFGLILAHKDDIGSKADDPVYGDRIAKTWKALTDAAGSRDGIDFGISRFPRHLLQGSEALTTSKQCAPVLMPAYADLWSQTSPIPNADPEAALFLHGPDRSPATVQIVWRADLELDRRGFDAEALLTAMPPKPGETIEVSLSAARRWLREEQVSDFPDTPSLDDQDTAGGRGRAAFRWAGPDNQKTGLAYANQLRPHDLIVVPSVYGGCDHFGWDPEPRKKRAVPDVADAAAAPFLAHRYALRLTSPLLQSALPADEQSGDLAERKRFPEELSALLGDFRDGGAPAKIDDLILRLISAGPPRFIRNALQLLSSAERADVRAVFPYGDDDEGRPRGVVLLALKGIRSARMQRGPGSGGWELEGGMPSTEDDRLGLVGEPVLLEDHSRDVRDRSARFAIDMGLEKEITADVALAGFLHDAGKADPRFQAMLYGGDWFAANPTKVLAKSRDGGHPGAWERAGLPMNWWRHEALSVRIACALPRLEEAHDKELVLWLIGVHHGYGRPFFPHIDVLDERDRELASLGGTNVILRGSAGPQSLAFNFNGLDWPQMFERLKRRYGIWGLARLEATLRLADHRASETATKRASKEPMQ